MQKLFRLLLVASLFLVSCVGQDGEDGINILGQAFEVELDFYMEDDFKTLVPYPSNIEVYDGDVVMVYALDIVDGDLDIWEPLPRTFYFEDGILMYGFNYSLVDVQLFLDGTVNLYTLSNELTQNLIFRVVILPADLAVDVDLNNYNSVMSVVDRDLVLK